MLNAYSFVNFLNVLCVSPPHAYYEAQRYFLQVTYMVPYFYITL